MSEEDPLAIPTFHWADYLVLGMFFLLTTLLGIFIGWRDRRKATSKEFLMGGGDMHYVPVALSMQASFLSAIYIMSYPAEIYNFGTMFYYLAVSYLTALPLAGYVYLPIFHKLKLTSAYEYLERRFNRTVRMAGSLTFAVMVILYMSVVLYTPAIALAQVTGLSLAISVSVCGGVCVVYTVLGGMKATIWNDFIQMMVILISQILLIIFGLLKVGGKVWTIAEEGGRIEFDNFNPDPTIRTTFWTQTVGGTFLHLTMYASSQTIIQKFLSVKKLKNAQKSIWVAACSSVLILTLVCIVGLIMYAYYAHCDPILSGRVQKSDQMIPLFALDVMGDLHGLPGLFIAATFSAALSSISGSLNALAAIFLVDFIIPIYTRKNKRPLPDRMGSIISRLIAGGFGLFTIGMGFAAQYFGDLVLNIAFSIFGFVGGPLTALLSLGLFFPFVNSWGALSGLIVSLGITSWIAIGSMVAQIPLPTLVRLVDGCPVSNSSTTAVAYTSDYYTLVSFIQTSSSTPEDGEDSVLWVYKLSNMYYGLIAMAVAFVVAIPISLITGRDRDIDERLTYQWGKKCCCYCPESCIDCLRCGSKHYDSDDEDSKSSKNLSIIDDVIEVKAYDNLDFVGDDVKSPHDDKHSLSDVSRSSSSVKRRSRVDTSDTVSRSDDVTVVDQIRF